MSDGSNDGTDDLQDGQEDREATPSSCSLGGQPADGRTIVVPFGSKVDVLSKGSIGPYKLIEFIGMGGTGMVYRAKDADGAEIALKVMVVTPLMTREDIRRFISEAEMSKRLRRHPNIITVYDTGHEEQNYYIAMELVPKGRTLDDLVGRNISVEEFLGYVIPVAEALAYAHKEGILHRDLKPGNILLNEFNQPLLADFGLAKSETAQRMTMTGTVMGTPRYMSPEQCGFGSAHVTNQSDIYSFGVLAYELLTGMLPYHAFTPDLGLAEVFKIICSAEPVPPRKLRPDVSRNLEAVILRMLEKELKLRYKDMGQVCEDLIACREGRPVSVRRLSWAERFEKWVRFHAPQAITAALAIFAGCILYFGFILPKAHDKTYAKQNADVNALAAKRKAALLEKELEALKHPGSVKGDDDSRGTQLLQQARASLAEGTLDKAYDEFKAAREWAEKNGHNGILAESLFGIGRIALAKGRCEDACKTFDVIAALCGKETLYGRLAIFEAASALWIEGRKDDALKAWGELAGTAGGSKDFDSEGTSGYIVSLAEMMLQPEKYPDMEDKVSSSPQIFRGLGYWTLAQCAKDDAEKTRFAADAARQKGIFIWIKKEEAR